VGFSTTPSELANALTVVLVPFLAMDNSRDPDSIHDEYGPAEVLEAVIAKFQRASVVSIKGVKQADEATSCLALFGMRWLNASEIREESRRRNLSRHSPERPQHFESTHTATSLGTPVPSQHTPEPMRQTGDCLLPPYSSASSQDDFADSHDPQSEIT
jgi:hypothetical protein